MEEGKVRYIRVRGRIIPIRAKGPSSGEKTAIAGGGLVAGEALRHKVIKQTARHTFIRSAPTAQLAGIFGVGKTLTMKTAAGKTIGHVDYKIRRTTGSVSMVSVAERFQGRGHSKTMLKEVGRELSGRGIQRIEGLVISPRSLNFFRGTKGVKQSLESAGGSLGAMKAQAVLDSGDFVRRSVTFPKLRASTFKPFRTRLNKLQIGVGLGIAALGVASWLKRSTDEK